MQVHKPLFYLQSIHLTEDPRSILFRRHTGEGWKAVKLLGADKRLNVMECYAWLPLNRQARFAFGEAPTLSDKVRRSLLSPAGRFHPESDRRKAHKPSAHRQGDKVRFPSRPCVQQKERKDRLIRKGFTRQQYNAIEKQHFFTIDSDTYLLMKEGRVRVTRQVL